MEAKDFESYMKSRPHLVILGAGATVAAIPNGDANGKKAPVMNGFIETVGLKDLLNGVHLNTNSENLEEIYSELSQKEQYKGLLQELNDKIYDYFCEFEIPETPTVYDYLLFSLTKKDVVATFNWDPLILQAYDRILVLTNDLPELLFLHGNVSIGRCDEHKIIGYINQLCPTCKKKLKPIPLLYPVANKNYDEDNYIRYAWNALRYYLGAAVMLTIFGYSAPKTDAAAIAIFKEAWGNVYSRNLEQVEIIDIKPEEELVKTWRIFIHSHHYKVRSSFFDSFLACFPRRSCEKFFDQYFNCEFVDERYGIKPGMGFRDLKNFL